MYGQSAPASEASSNKKSIFLGPMFSKSHQSLMEQRGLVKTNRSASYIPLDILLDFNIISFIDEIRRSSFLPDSFFGDECDGGTNVSRKSFAYEDSAVKLTESTRQEKYCTGSKYVGPTNALGMHGKGIYRYPHGVIYDGHFNRNGDFHGTGTLVYPNGQRIEGLWRNGKMIKGANFVAADTSTFDSSYCKMPDRRYMIEIRKDVQAAGQEFLTNSDKPQKIPQGMYDTGEGFFDPIKRTVINYKDATKSKSLVQLYNNDMDQYELLEDEKPTKQVTTAKQQQFNRDPRIQDIPLEVKEKWVKTHCRKAWDEPTGFQPQLYETWTAGYKKDRLLRYENKLANDSVDDLLDHISQTEQSVMKSTNFLSFVPKASDVFAKILDFKTRRIARGSSVEHLANMFKRQSDKVKSHSKRSRKRKGNQKRSSSVG